MPGVKVLTKAAAASKAGKTLGTSSNVKAKSQRARVRNNSGVVSVELGTLSSAKAAKILPEYSVEIRKVHVAPKAGSVSRAAAKSAVKKAIVSRNMDGGKK